MTALTIKRSKAIQKQTATYLKLAADWTPRPIRTRADFDRAMAVLVRMAGHEDMDPGERDYFEAVTAFVEAYDRANGLPAPDTRSPTEKLRAIVRSAGLSVKQLGEIVGAQPLASALLSGKREPSKEVCRKLGAHFKVNPGYFL